MTVLTTPLHAKWKREKKIGQGLSTQNPIGDQREADEAEEISNGQAG
jgi:hypothetical protein